ncbi:MAG: hypothetical protein AAF438_13045 [Pseudomonadota bacterium]
MRTFCITLIMAIWISASAPSFAEYKMPSWLSDHIHLMQPMYVARYVYNKQTAYVLAYPSTEEGSPVFDANGKRLCVLGTWDWNTSPGCPKFLEQAKNEQIVWGEK